jgi:hypothetical protein
MLEPMAATSDSVLTVELARRLVDEFLEVYLQWREQALALQDTYSRWRGAAPEDRALAFAAYRAMLDLEERAAQVYAECAGRVAELDGARSAAQFSDRF